MNFMRRRPPQITTLEELQSSYDEVTDLVISYLHLEETHKFTQALNGWKSLHTSLSYKIEYFSKLKRGGEEDEIFQHLKAIRDQNIKHLVRVQLRCEEEDRIAKQNVHSSSKHPVPPPSNSRANSYSLNVPSLRNNHTMNTARKTNARPMLKSLRQGKHSSFSDVNSAASKAASLSWKQDDIAKHHSRSTSNVSQIRTPKDPYDSVFNDFDQDTALIDLDSDNNDNEIDENLMDLVNSYNGFNFEDSEGGRVSHNPVRSDAFGKSQKSTSAVPPPPPPHMVKISKPLYQAKPSSQPSSRRSPMTHSQTSRPSSAPKSSQPRPSKPTPGKVPNISKTLSSKSIPKPLPKSTPKQTSKVTPKPAVKTTVSKTKRSTSPVKGKSSVASAKTKDSSNSRPPKNTESDDDDGIRKDTETLSSGSSEKNDSDLDVEIIDDIDEDEIINSIKGIDQNAAKQILNEIVVHGDEVYWEDIAGLHSAKNSLKEAVVYPFLRPDLFSGLREPARGMLLFGPPGTGKTMLARAVATESKSTFFSISASSLTSKYLGESEKLVRALFMLAKKLAPSIVFIDEIDSLLSARSENEVDSSRRIKNEFLIQWSDLSSAAARDKGSDLERVLILGATNIPWGIDEAARRRFVRRQYIPLPEVETRKAQILKLLSHQKHTLSEIELCALTEKTDGFSGSDITALAKDAAMGPLRSLGDKLLSTPREHIRPIGLVDFESSLKYIRPSVSKEGLKQYEEWASKFGSSGV